MASRMCRIWGAVVCCLFLFSASLSWAQMSAGLTGVVTDTSGAIVPNVTVMATNQLTGVKTTAPTNVDGVYQFLELLPGPYVVEATASGFKTISSRAVLEVAQIANVNFTLEVGSTSQTVTVSAQAAELSTQSATVSNLIGEQMISNLPVVSRNVYDLLPLMMGFSTGWTGSGDPAMGGSIPGATNYYIDGVNATDSRVGVSGGLSFPMKTEWASEFKVLNNSFSAEYGGNGGALILMTTKSGTDQFHGSLWEFNQSEGLSARNYFAVAKTPLHKNDFGGELGGPILRRKLFFFGSYDGLRSHTSTLSGQLNSVFETVPTAAERQGDFSQNYNAAGQVMPIYDPYSTVMQPDGSITRTQISCNGQLNVICPNRISPIAQAVLSYVPTPNHTPADPSGTNNFYGTANALTFENYEAGRVDWNPSNKDVIFGRLSHDSGSGEGYGPWPALQGFNASKIAYVHNTTDRNPADPSEYENPSHDGSVAAGWTRTITPNLISELRGGVNWRFWLYEGSSSGLNFAQTIGLPVPAPISPNLPDGRPDNAFPNFSAGQYALPGGGGYGAGQALPNLNTWNAAEAISWIHGRHSLKFGFDWTYSNEHRYEDNNSSGTYNFSQSSTSSNGIDPNSGNALASMLLDFPVNGSLKDTITQEFKTNYFAWFVQDDWRVNRRITLNLGLRHDIDTPITEAKNRITGFDPTAINPVSGTPGVITFPTRFTNPVYTSFGPRFGISFNPGNGSWVYRGGYGLFFNEYMQLDPWSIPGWNRPDVSVSVNGVASSLFVNQPPYTLASGLPAPPPFDPSQLNPGFGAVAKSPDGFYHPNYAVSYIPMNNKAGYEHQLEVSVQHQMWNNTTIAEVGYAGTFGRDLSVCNGGLGCSVETNALSPSQELALGFQATSNDNPFPQFASAAELGASRFSSWYDSGYAKVQRRWSNGLTFLTHFTWSKNIDNYSMFCCTQPDFYRRNGRGRSWTDRKYRYVFAGTYDLPVGPGERFQTHGIATYVLGGWRLAPAFTANSGQPLTAFMANVPGAVVPDCVGNPNSGPKTLHSWFNVSAFQAPQPFTYGNCGTGEITGPGYVDLDSSMQKDFPVPFGKESTKLNFRVDAYNVLNHTNFGNPSTTICPSSSPCTTNLITSTPPAASLSSRVVQLGVNLSF